MAESKTPPRLGARLARPPSARPRFGSARVGAGLATGYGTAAEKCDAIGTEIGAPLYATVYVRSHIRTRAASYFSPCNVYQRADEGHASVAGLAAFRAAVSTLCSPPDGPLLAAGRRRGVAATAQPKAVAGTEDRIAASAATVTELLPQRVQQCREIRERRQHVVG